jgi:lipoprotein-releasing system ATP-binding protein
MFLNVENLTKSYGHEPNRVFALRDVSFALTAGKSLAICGGSGAGKSTLLSLIGGLNRPDSGRVLLDGHDLFSLTEKKEALFRRTALGFIFQSHHLLLDFTVIENVMMPLIIAGVKRKLALDEARTLLAKVGLATMTERNPRELSGGEQQRAAMARAIIHKPKLILADEPTGNLDETNASLVFDLLCALNRDLGASLIVVTHNREFAKKLNAILTLHSGSVQSLKENRGSIEA